MTTIEMTNYEALHGWGRVINHIEWWTRTAMRDVNVTLKSAEQKMFEAYDMRTSTATTVDLTAGECAAVADVLAETEEERILRHPPTNATPHVRSLEAKLRTIKHDETREIVPDYRTEAATFQGLDPMHERLTKENIAHEVNDTGGATMIVQIFLSDDGWLHVERGDDWTGDDSADDWTIFRFDQSGEQIIADLGFNLDMSDALTVICRVLENDGVTRVQEA